MLEPGTRYGISCYRVDPPDQGGRQIVTESTVYGDIEPESDALHATIIDIPSA